MRNCQEVQDLLSFYLDDCLDTHEKAQVEEHLKQCSDCQMELQELQETINMFAELNEEELIPPASFRHQLREKLEKEQKTSKDGLWNRFTKFIDNTTLKAWIPLAAAAMLLIIIIPVVINGFGPMGAKSNRMEQAKMEESSYGITADKSVREPARLEGPREDMGIMDNATDGETAKLKAELVQEAAESQVSEAEVERKIIKTANLNLEVDDYKITSNKIKAIVQEVQGYVVNENTHVYNQERQLLAGNIAIRIPQERFDEALTRVEGMGKVNNRDINAQDVTEEYVDVQSRLKAMRVKEERLLAILTESGALADVLAVENELARTRADLEALEGRLRYLNNRTELSTIHVSMRETLTPVKEIKTTGFAGVLARTQQAFVKSINAIIIGTGNLVVYLGAFLPYLILLIFALVVLLILWRRRRKSKE